MYAQDEPDETEAELPQPPSMTSQGVGLRVETVGKFININIDGRVLTVPSSHYVSKLEHDLAETHRILLRFKHEMKQMRGKMNEMANEINVMNKEINKKVNLRD